MYKGTILIIIVLFSLISCKDNAINSQATVNKPIIDGVLDEWEGKLFTQKGEKLGFGVMNDDSTLYIAITTYDRQTIMQILRGLTIWIDPNSKKNKSFGIKYPIEADMAGLMDISNRNSDQNEDFEYFITQRLLQQSSMHYIKDDIVQYRDIGNDKGVQVKMFYNNGEINYELKIPFNEYNSKMTEKISIGFESVPMQRSNGSSDHSSGKSRGGGRGGGMSGGGMSGGGKGGGQGSGGMQSKMKGMPNPVNLWLDINLYKDKND